MQTDLQVDSRLCFFRSCFGHLEKMRLRHARLHALFKNTYSVFSVILTINYFMPIILLLFPDTSSLILICHVVFLYLYFNFFYVCIWTVVCNKGFIVIIILSNLKTFFYMLQKVQMERQ